MLNKCSRIWDDVRAKTPLVHCITNYVTVNDVANTILAGGGSPAMCEHSREARGFAGIASALYLNLGTLTDEQELAMVEAVKGAKSNGVPLIIDPVACGVIPRKVEVIKKLASNGAISCIKGNSAEIKSLAGFEATARGVDSLDQGEGLEDACQILAVRDNIVVAATGPVDVVGDGRRLALINNGTSLFGAITGAGCMVGGLVAACIGVAPEEAWLAAVSGITAFTIAGERAFQVSGESPGSFRNLFFDKLYQLRGKDIFREGRVEFRS